MADTGEVTRPGSGVSLPNGSFRKILDSLLIAAILGGAASYVKGEVTAAKLEAQTKRLDDLGTDLKAMRTELLNAIKDTREAIERAK